VVVDKNGNVYVADTGNHSIQKITPEGQISTLAGENEQKGSVDGLGAIARFDVPRGVAVDANGNSYLADSFNHTIRKVTPAGVVSTLAGVAGQQGTVDAPGIEARFRGPGWTAVDSSGTLYISCNSTIRRITPEGLVGTLAGADEQLGSTDGPGNKARFFFAGGITIDGNGNAYVADSGNQTIRKISPDGQVTTLAGVVKQTGFGDGPIGIARFNTPMGVTVDGSGNVYVADMRNHTIRKVTPDGTVMTLAGLAQESGSADGQGSLARFYEPQGVAVDKSGNVYVADTGNHTIRKITPSGRVSTIAGVAGQGTFVPGAFPGYLVFPIGLALTPDGDLVVTCNNGIIQITVP
jgi:sugar lactone lactonase YvrE